MEKELRAFSDRMIRPGNLEWSGKVGTGAEAVLRRGLLSAGQGSIGAWIRGQHRFHQRRCGKMIPSPDKAAGGLSVAVVLHGGGAEKRGK
jgi:hypothetical protein